MDIQNALTVGADIGQEKGEPMSVLIKGIDIPKDIDELRLIINGMSIAIEPTEAIQIPKPHGRLIDEKEAIRGWCKGCAFNDGTCGKDETICEDKEMCKYTPTILEAED